MTLTLSDGTCIRINGKIDRIDRSDDGTMFRIVDYKTGKGHTFSATKFASGETIQLPLYLEAAKKLGGEAVGMYYMPLNAKPPESPDDPPKNMLSGVTASDETAIRASDGHLCGASEIIDKLKVDQKGYAGDLITREQIEALKDRAIAIAEKNAERILDGDAEMTV